MNSNIQTYFAKDKLCPNKVIFQQNVFHLKFLFEYQFGDLLSQRKKQLQIIQKNLFELKFLVINDLLFPSGLIFINIIFVRIKIDHINYTKPQWKN